jgi:ribosomal protein S5
MMMKRVKVMNKMRCKPNQKYGTSATWKNQLSSGEIFCGSVIVGDNKLKVGVGIGRAEDVNLAIDKAILHAQKNIINVC